MSNFFASYPVNSGGGGSGFAFGIPAVGYTPGEVVYIDALGNTYGDPLFTRNSSNNATLIAAQLSVNVETGLDVNGFLPGSALINDDSANGITNLFAVGDLTGLGYTPNTTVILYSNQTIHEYSKIVLYPGQMNIRRSDPTNTTAEINFLPNFVSFTFNDGLGFTSGIRATGQQLYLTNLTYDWQWPTSDSAGYLSSNGSGVLSFGPVIATLPVGSDAFQWYNWNNLAGIQSWQQIWVYTDTSGALDNTILGHYACGLSETVNAGIGTLNTVVGSVAFKNLSNGTANTVMGYSSAFGRTQQTDRCVIIGAQTPSQNASAISDSVFLGWGVGVSGGQNVHIGSGAAPNAQDGIFGNLNVIIGSGAAPNIVANTENVIIGANAGASLWGGSGGAGNMFLGVNAGAGFHTNPQNCIAIGINTTFDSPGITGSIVLGSYAHCDQSNTMVVGAPSQSVQDAYFGSGIHASAPVAAIGLHGTDAENGYTDINGTRLQLYGGQNTGTGTGGSVEIWPSNITAISGSSTVGGFQAAYFGGDQSFIIKNINVNTDTMFLSGPNNANLVTVNGSFSNTRNSITGDVALCGTGDLSGLGYSTESVVIAHADSSNNIAYSLVDNIGGVPTIVSRSYLNSATGDGIEVDQTPDYLQVTDNSGTLFFKIAALSGQINAPTVPAYADDAAAATGGLVHGDIFQTTGTSVTPQLQVAGLLMIKQ